MKRIISSDWHIGKNTVDEEELFAVLYYILEQAIFHKCTHLDVLGDLLENRALLLFRLWPRVKKFFNDAVDSGLIVSILAGNHDFYSTTTRTECNLRHVKLNDKVRIIDQITREDDITYVPWLFPGEVIPEGGKVVLAHIAVNGFKLHQYKTEEHGVELPSSSVPIYTGHFHTSQVGGMVRYLGNILHQTLNDANETKCAYILASDYEVELAIELNSKFTNFIKVDYPDLKTLNLPYKSRVVVKEVPRGEEELVSRTVFQLGAASVECISQETPEEHNVIQMTKGLSVDEAIVEQIQTHNMKDELLEIHNIFNTTS